MLRGNGLSGRDVQFVDVRFRQRQGHGLRFTTPGDINLRHGIQGGDVSREFERVAPVLSQRLAGRQGHALPTIAGQARQGVTCFEGRLALGRQPLGRCYRQRLVARGFVCSRGWLHRRH